jgi:hypothetical protein
LLGSPQPLVGSDGQPTQLAVLVATYPKQTGVDQRVAWGANSHLVLQFGLSTPGSEDEVVTVIRSVLAARVAAAQE